MNKVYNRDILFRGKQVSNDDWIEGYVFSQCIDGGYVPLCIATEPICANDYSEILGDWAAVDSSTVGQYTGLTDKNGKKIFEGDIVKTKFGRICKVIFFQSPCYCGIDLIPLEDKHKCPDKFDLYLSDNLEIIGNIHDNPELLEES